MSALMRNHAAFAPNRWLGNTPAPSSSFSVRCTCSMIPAFCQCQLLSPALFRDRNARVEREGVRAGARTAGSGPEKHGVAESRKAGAQKSSSA
jgi:hypothetical protein